MYFQSIKHLHSKKLQNQLLNSRFKQYRSSTDISEHHKTGGADQCRQISPEQFYRKGYDTNYCSNKTMTRMIVDKQKQNINDINTVSHSDKLQRLQKMFYSLEQKYKLLMIEASEQSRQFQKDKAELQQAKRKHFEQQKQLSQLREQLLIYHENKQLKNKFATSSSDKKWGSKNITNEKVQDCNSQLRYLRNKEEDALQLRRSLIKNKYNYSKEIDKGTTLRRSIDNLSQSRMENRLKKSRVAEENPKFMNNESSHKNILPTTPTLLKKTMKNSSKRFRFEPTYIID